VKVPGDYRNRGPGRAGGLRGHGLGIRAAEPGTMAGNRLRSMSCVRQPRRIAVRDQAFSQGEQLRRDTQGIPGSGSRPSFPTLLSFEPLTVLLPRRICATLSSPSIELNEPSNRTAKTMPTSRAITRCSQEPAGYPPWPAAQPHCFPRTRRLPSLTEGQNRPAAGLVSACIILPYWHTPLDQRLQFPRRFS